MLGKFDVLVEDSGPAADATRKMRKFGIQYALLHPQHDTVKARFIGSRSLDEWYEVVNQCYSGHAV